MTATVETLAGLADELRARIAAELADTLDPERLLAPTAHDEQQVIALISERLADLDRERVIAGHPPLDPDQQEIVARQVFDALLRLGPLQRYLADPEVEEITVNGHRRAFIHYAGGRKAQIPTGFGAEAELRTFATRTAAAAGRRLDEANPSVDAHLPDGSRLHVITPPLAPYTCVTIRRHRLVADSLDDLVRLGVFGRDIAAFLAAVVRAGLNVLISGGTASGKTTTLQAIGTAIPDLERVVTIEETRELALDRHLGDCIPLEARTANSEGIGEVPVRRLVREALRMRPNRIIVGEVRGPEGLDMVLAMNSGHQGSMGTLHADSARDALDKLAIYISMAPERLSDATITKIVAATIDLVLHLRLAGDGRRVLAEVAEVAGLDHTGGVLTNTLISLDPQGTPRFTGLQPLPRTVERLAEAGWRLPTVLRPRPSRDGGGRRP